MFKIKFDNTKNYVQYDSNFLKHRSFMFEDLIESGLNKVELDLEKEIFDDILLIGDTIQYEEEIRFLQMKLNIRNDIEYFIENYPCHIVGLNHPEGVLIKLPENWRISALHKK